MPRIPVLLALGSLLAALCFSGAYGGNLSSLPELSAVEIQPIPLPTDGVRGLLVSDGSLVLLAGQNRGLSARDSSYVVQLLRFSLSSGELSLIATEQDLFETGLTTDGENWWSSGSLLGVQSQIYQISPADGSILLTLPFPGAHPGGIAFDGTYLWVVDCDARKMERVEVEEGRVSRKVATPSFYPTGLAYDGYHFWCADATTGRIYRMKGYNGRPDAVIAAEDFSRPGEFVSLSWKGGSLWAVAASDSFALKMKLGR